jgi:hypothetical protein
MNDNQDFSGNQKRFADERIAAVAASGETGNAILKALHKQMGQTLVNFPESMMPTGSITMTAPTAPQRRDEHE